MSFAIPPMSSRIKNALTTKTQQEAKQKFQQKMAEAAEQVQQRRLHGDPQVNALLQQAQDEINLENRLLKLQLPNVPGQTTAFTKPAPSAPKTVDEQVNALLKETQADINREHRLLALSLPNVPTHKIG
jgi:hypothetical protein